MLSQLQRHDVVAATFCGAVFAGSLWVYNKHQQYTSFHASNEHVDTQPNPIGHPPFHLHKGIFALTSVTWFTTNYIVWNTISNPSSSHGRITNNIINFVTSNRILQSLINFVAPIAKHELAFKNRFKIAAPMAVGTLAISLLTFKKTRQKIRELVPPSVKQLLTHPYCIKFLQFAGYVGVPLFRILMLFKLLQDAEGSSNMSSVKSDGSMISLFNNFGELMAILNIINVFYVDVLKYAPVYTYAKQNEILYGNLVLKSCAFGCLLLDPAFGILNYNGIDDSKIKTIIQGVGNLAGQIPIFASLYCIRLFTNVIHIIVNKYLPHMVDDFYLRSQKAKETILWAVVGLFLDVFITRNHLLNNSTFCANGIDSKYLIYKNELYFYALPLLYYLYFTRDSIFITKMSKNLYLTNLYTVSDEDTIRKYNIRNVIELHGSGKGENRRKHSNVNYLVIRIEDRVGTRLMDYFGKTNNFIEQCVNRNENVIVHCQFGVSRSSSVVAAYFIGKLGYDFDRAMNRMMRLRPQCMPNNGYMLQLREYSLKSKYSQEGQRVT